MLLVVVVVLVILLVVWYMQPRQLLGKRVRYSTPMVQLNVPNCGALYPSGVVTGTNYDGSVVVKWDSLVSNPDSAQCMQPLIPMSKPEGIHIDNDTVFWFQLSDNSKKYMVPTTLSKMEADQLIVL